jgi:D-sedoheptulose 7-phosphate isomerase
MHERGVLTFALPGRIGDYATVAPAQDPFIHQELIEVLYHTLWETVHVFLEHGDMGHDVGESAFLYPFLGRSQQDTSGVLDDVAASIVAKAAEDERLRGEIARHSSESLSQTALDIRDRIDDGGKILTLGNGGSATDANDFVFDCLMPCDGMATVPAISLSMEPAVLSAISNDVGEEAVFVRQVIAHGAPKDVVLAFSTSGSSRNVIAALKEARKRGLLTVALTGYEGGEIAAKDLADSVLIAPSDHIPRIQEIHASMYHVLRRTIDNARGSMFD